LDKLDTRLTDGSTVCLTIPEYTRDYKELLAVVTTMEGSIKTLLKKFDAYRKTIKSDSALFTERQLFIYFFTDHSQLQTVIGELSSKIDNLAI